MPPELVVLVAQRVVERVIGHLDSGLARICVRSGRQRRFHTYSGKDYGGHQGHVSFRHGADSRRDAVDLTRHAFRGSIRRSTFAKNNRGLDQDRGGSPLGVLDHGRKHQAATASDIVTRGLFPAGLSYDPFARFGHSPKKLHAMRLVTKLAYSCKSHL